MAALDRLWSLRDERPWFVAVSLVTLASIAVYPLVDWWLRTNGIAGPYMYYDFGAYVGALERLESAKPLYRRTDAGGYHGSFLYPPIATLLFVPFEGMGFRQAASAWMLVSVGLLWVSLQALIATLGYRLRRWERAGLFVLLVGFHPVVFAMKQGQLAPFMAGLLTLVAVSLLWERPESGWPSYAAGGLTAVVGVVKLSYAPVGAHLLQDRRRFLSAVGVGVALAILSVLLYGVAVHRTYVDVLLWGIREGSAGRPPTLWLPGYYDPLRWLPAPQWLRVAASLSVAGYAALAPRDATRLVFCLGVAAFPLLAPITYTYYLVALLPVVVLLLDGELSREDGYPWVPVVGLLLLHLHAYGLRFVVEVAPKLFPPIEAFHPYGALQPGLWGNALLFGLAFYRVAGTIERPVRSSSPAESGDADADPTETTADPTETG